MNLAKVFDLNSHDARHLTRSFPYSRKILKFLTISKSFALIFIADVDFNITFNGDEEEYPNYMGFMLFDFNDSETFTRLVDFKEISDRWFLDIQNHTYKSYGTYYPKLVLKNNISEVEHNFSLEVEQCVNDFQIGFTVDR